jgi:rod shape-determining protein MreC
LLSTDEPSPPPLFRQGPASLVRLFFFISLSLALLVADLHFHTLESFRQAVALILQPIQRVAYMPVEAVSDTREYLAARDDMKSENTQLRQHELTVSNQLLRQHYLEEENRRLRALLDMREQQPVTGRVAEILYTARDPFTRKIIVDKGSTAGIEAGQPVIDEFGVIGQVTRAYLSTSEVTLLTDKNQALPVQVQRTGLRAVLAGVGNGTLELRFLASNVDVQPGDVLVTSGLDGIYLPGLPAARVVNVNHDDSFVFARIICMPLAGVDRHGQVLILGKRVTPPQPEETEPIPTKPAKGAKPRITP